jgi:ATP-dependent RNA helicase DeaD
MLPVPTVRFCVSCRLGYSCDSLHGDKTQQMRDRAMERYRNGQLRVLIATDVASRGLDVKVISVALMFHLSEPCYASLTLSADDHR